MADVVRKIQSNGVCETTNAPSGIYYDGKTFYGSITTNGYAQVSCYNHTTGNVTTFSLGYVEADSHCSPVLWLRPDGKIVAFWSKHSGPTLYWRITSNAGDISSWGSVQSKSVTNITYPTPIYLSDESTLYLFFRGGTSDDMSIWSYIKSTDNGATFGDVTEFYQGAANQEYLRIVSNGTDVIHFVNSEHPSESPSVYHFYYDGGSFYQTDGTLIGDSDDFPILQSETTVVYNSGDVGHYDAFKLDIALLSGSPVILFATWVDYDPVDIRLNYAKYSGGSWLHYEISSIDSVVESDPYDVGGASFDQDAPATVWFTKAVSSILEVYKAVTADGGETWTPTQITSSSAYNNFRIRFVAGNVDTFNIFWSRGVWNGYTSYDADLYGLLSDALPAPSFLPSAPPTPRLKPSFGIILKRYHPIVKGLVAFWPFNEGSGDVINDLVGNNHGAPVIGGGSTWVAGKFGTARYFNGSDQNIRFLDGGPTDISGSDAQITLLAWARLDSLAASAHLINKYLATTGNRQYQFYYHNGYHAMRFNLSYNGTAADSLNSNSSVIENGDWHQIVATCDGLYMRVYTDGLLDCTPLSHTSGIYNCPQDFRIASSPAGDWWNGAIDHVAIWNRALSAEEIAQLYFDPWCIFEEAGL